MINLEISLAKLKSILCLNGEIPNREFFLRHADLPIIAADGASNTLISMGFIPKLIIGDLDSIDRSIIPPATEIMHITDQDSTDSEKSLLVMAQRELFPCLVYGATGKELDHTLHNLTIMAAYSKLQSIIFHDSVYKTQEKYGVFVTDKFTGQLKIGAKISLLSLSSALISSKGLKWELNQMHLSAQHSSIRNEVKVTNIEITVHSGTVLILFDHSLFNS